MTRARRGRIELSACLGGLACGLVTLAVVLPAQEPPKASVPEAPGTGGVVGNLTGGPDAFGYTFADQASGCASSFVDISTTGTAVDWSGAASGGCSIPNDDCSSGPVALAAPFDLYGTPFSSLVMATNGYISTEPTDQGPDLSNDCPIPASPSTGGGARLYPLHDDLTAIPFSGAGWVEYFPTCPRASDRCAANEDCTIFLWDDVALFSDQTASFDFEVILYHQTSDVVYQFGPGNPQAGSSSTTGLQDFPPPTTALLYACNAAGSVADGTALCISHPDPVPPACSGAPPPQEIPTASAVGLAGLLIALVAAGYLLVRRQG